MNTRDLLYLAVLVSRDGDLSLQQQHGVTDRRRLFAELRAIAAEVQASKSFGVHQILIHKDTEIL